MNYYLWPSCKKCGVFASNGFNCQYEYKQSLERKTVTLRAFRTFQKSYVIANSLHIRLVLWLFLWLISSEMRSFLWYIELKLGNSKKLLLFLIEVTNFLNVDHKMMNKTIYLSKLAIFLHWIFFLQKSFKITTAILKYQAEKDASMFRYLRYPEKKLFLDFY